MEADSTSSQIAPLVFDGKMLSSMDYTNPNLSGDFIFTGCCAGGLRSSSFA